MAPRAPLTRDRPFAWEALASMGNRPINVRSEHIPLFGEVAAEPLPDPRERLFRGQGKR